MKRRCTIALVVVAVLGGILQITGCSSPRTRHEWLTLFFDGVPAENSGRPAAAQPVDKAAAIVVVPPVPKPPFEVLHRPYEQQKCGACHDSSTVSTNAKLPLLQLCFTCHKDFLAEKTVKHQPVGNGECLECHAPHKSPNKNLLLQKGDAMCLTCHDDPLAVGKVKHQGVEMSTCLDCHSPHATNFKGLLKESVKDTCAECHDSVIGKKKYVHQPVGNGDCLECHAPHASKFPKLLKRSVADTCADCHEDLAGKNAKSVHQPVASGDCLECHDPHASNEKALVKQTVPGLCWTCHDDFREKAKFQHFGVVDCTSCHKPHASAEKKTAGQERADALRRMP